MKRASELCTNEDGAISSKKVARMCVQRQSKFQGGLSFANSNEITKKKFSDIMKLSESASNVNIYNIAKQEQLDVGLHTADCNFVKKPGHIYHLYERPLGLKYFSMLSPEEWSNCPPHRYLGSYMLRADQSFTPAKHINGRYEGLDLIELYYHQVQAINS